MVQHSPVVCPLLLRSCDQQDAALLSLVGQATFLDSYAGVLNGADILGHCQKNHSVEAYSVLLRKQTTRAYLLEAEPGLAPVGYAVLTEPDLPLPDLTAADTELKRIYVLSRFHGSGAGQRLLHECVAYAKQQGKKRLLLGVYERNTRALMFYRKMGFREIGTREFLVGQNRYHDFVLGMSLRDAD